MNTDQLFANLDRFCEIPGAIPTLREFILELAVRGKLVDQDSSDEPASLLFDRIQSEKLSLAEADKTRREKPLPLLDSSEQPFMLPSNWKWARIRQITGEHGQVIPNTEFSYIDVSAVDNVSGRLIETTIYTPSEAPSRARKVVQTGDILYSCVRPYLLNVAIIENDINPPAIASTAFAVLDGFGLVLPKYLWIILRSPFMIDQVVDKMRGQAYPAINDADFALLPFPLAPINEQHRIIAKVDELMAVCDQLEMALVERESWRSELLDASLEQLSHDAENAAPQRDAQSYLESFSQIITKPAHLVKLRQFILSLAIRGKLVPQELSDEPIIDLLRRLQLEKMQEAASEIPKRGKGIFRVVQATMPLEDVQKLSLPASGPPEFEFRLPSGWNWAKIEHVAEARLGKMLDESKNSGKLYRYLRNTNVHWFDIRLEELKELRVEETEVDKYLLQPNDVLICEGGHGIGRTAVWKEILPDVVFQKALHRIRPGPALNSHFFSYCMFVYFHASVLQPYFTGGGIPHLTGKALSNIVFPIPPIVEQARIVKRAGGLLQMCDQLENQLVLTQNEGRNSLEAVLNQALGTTVFTTDTQKLPEGKRGSEGQMQHLGATSDERQGTGSSSVHFSPSNPVRSLSQLIQCLEALGGEALAERLLNLSGLGDDVDTFFALLREGKKQKVLSVPIGVNQVIRRLNNEN